MSIRASTNLLFFKTAEITTHKIIPTVTIFAVYLAKKKKLSDFMMNTTCQRFDNVSTKFCILYCAFLLVISSLGKNEEYWENFTSGDEWNDNSTMSYELDANSMINQDNKTTLMHYNLHANSVKNENETNFVPHERNGNSNENDDDHKNDDDNIVLYKMCNNTCIQHCCHLIQDNCDFQKIVDSILNDSISTVEDAIDYSCEEKEVPFDITNNENAMFFDDSPLNLSRRDRFISLMTKCFYITSYDNETTCNAMVDHQVSIYFIIIYAILIASLLCLLMTFIVYSICPKLRNMHGYALRSYVASLFVVYTIFLITEEDLFEETYPACVVEILLYLFCYLASLLWQNVICFDILRTFGGFGLLRKGVTSKRTIFLKSSFYAWGIASTYVIICVAMEFLPNAPQNIRPDVCINSKFGFANNEYFMIPVGVIIVCNICFFIFTMLNIMYAKKDTDRFLKDSESKRHTDDKQRFMLYLKLFLLMDISVGLKWILVMIIVILQSYGIRWPRYVPVIMDVMESLQGLIIFIVFVCKKRIMLLLLKGFNCENNCLYDKTLTSDNCHIATSHTSSTTVTEMSTQKVNSNMQDNCHVKNSSEVVENTTI